MGRSSHLCLCGIFFTLFLWWRLGRLYPMDNRQANGVPFAFISYREGSSRRSSVVTDDRRRSTTAEAQ